MKVLSIDIETYSATDLAKAGVYAYTEDPDFEIQLFGFACDDDEVEVIDLTKDKMPKVILDALTSPDILKTAYNANFERTCLSAWYGIELPPE